MVANMLMGLKKMLASPLVWVGVMLTLSAILAITSLLGDSITYDETSHLTAGYSYLKTGDFRLSPDHPPLGRVWAALPLLFVDNTWPDPSSVGWREYNVWLTGEDWLFKLNDGERLIIPARCMMVVLMLATGLAVYFAARRLLGGSAAILAVALAAFSPTMLAHGRYVTTDMPLTLTALLTILAFARLLQRITWPRIVLAALALTAMCLAKFSWPLILPALVTMFIVALVRKTPLAVSLLPGRKSKSQTQPASSPPAISSRPKRAIVLLLSAAVIGFLVWGGIWGCFQFRYTPFSGESLHISSWDAVMIDRSSQPLTGPVVDFVQWSRKHHFLPESYLYGISYTHWSSQERPSYLMGKIDDKGFRSYFPIAMALKTPIAEMILFVVGLTALLKRKIRVRDSVLFAAMVSFAGVYLFVAFTSKLNIGHRHMLPMYPLIFIFASASVGWLTTHAGKAILAGSLLWLAAAVAFIHPYYLSYFNELIGGPKNAHHYLVDSNIDWGQDIKRLAAYAKSHPDEKIKLAYFGSGNPSRYGFDCEMLPSAKEFAPPAKWEPGTYVVSVTQLMSLYTGMFDGRYKRIYGWAEFWDQPGHMSDYQILCQKFSGINQTSAEFVADPETKSLYQKFRNLQAGRLLMHLRPRQPDDRIGYSLFVFRLSQADLDEALK